ncbi:MAG: co-chaperone GroES [Lachnospiraceae bacterium]|nr:co-chaperone GroES [Lachnospiraceae bacterium]
MKLRPLGDRVVLKQLVAEETTKSGIVLPGQNKEKPEQAEVVAVGPGTVENGKEIKMQVKVGDQVVYSKYSGNQVKLDDEEYVIVKQSDILAVIEAEAKKAAPKAAAKPAAKAAAKKPAAKKTGKK